VTVRSIEKTAAGMPPVLSLRMKFEIYEETDGSYRWLLIASDGQLMASSKESYACLKDARRVVIGLQASIPVARIVDEAVDKASS